MVRRTALASFAFALLLVVACGRQVTPDPGSKSSSNLNLAGRMVVRFRTNGPMDFAKYTYAIVINTCGGGPPYPDAFATTFNNYSFSFLIGGVSGTAGPALVQYILTPGQSNSLNPQQVPLGASTTQFVPNSNQQNSEFQLTFVRQQLNNPLQVAQPCPLSGVAASPGPTAVATVAVATPSPTPLATASAAVPPNAQPTTFAQRLWYFNYFTIDNATNRVVDSLGVGGASDTTFNGIGIAVDQSNNYPIFRQAGSALPGDARAQIAGGQIDNFQ
ncbi:MAG: hypothetical protein NVS1B2_23910 [Vulcanimicrobiaceae bacterium]